MLSLYLLKGCTADFPNPTLIVYLCTKPKLEILSSDLT